MRKNRGFTLVELLVVIGVVAVLIAVMMPALQKARRSAVQLQCASNLRQVGAAVQAYANENRGVLPFAAMKVTPPGGGTHASMWCLSWDDLIAEHLGTRLTSAEKEAAFNYKGIRALQCPADPILPVYGTPGVQRRSYALTRLAVAPNLIDAKPFGGVAFQWTVATLADHAPNPKYQLKLNQIRCHSETFLAVEQPDAWNVQGYDYGAYVDAPSQVSQYVTWIGDPLTPARARETFHGDRWNFLYLDGHVSPLTLDQTVRNNNYSLPRGPWTRDPTD